MIKSTGFQILFICLFFFSVLVSGQNNGGSDEVQFFRKKELNNGILLGGNSEREQLLTSDSKRYEELTSGFAGYQFSSNFWNYLDYKQDELKIDFNLGPFGGVGNWLDSASVADINADHKLIGLRTSLSADYLQRYYFNSNNYTIVRVKGWMRYEWFQQNSKGTYVDSLGTSTEFDDTTTETKFRYGVEAQAGWGFGRLNVMNNYMLAQSIVEKYYAGRLFSEKEIREIADEIAIIKSQRDIINGHNAGMEAQILSDYLNEKLLLTMPESLVNDWEVSELNPRFNGSRFEIGPFFKFYNQEPDFVFGGYAKYENIKYSSFKWNRLLSATLKYNRYKLISNQEEDDFANEYYEGMDWMSAEINIGWSYYPDLKRQFDFGVKYIPAVEVNEFTELGDFNHGLVPYLAYFTQVNSKSRINLAFAYRISADEQLMLPGPEISLSFYRSRY